MNKPFFVCRGNYNIITCDVNLFLFAAGMGGRGICVQGCLVMKGVDTMEPAVRIELTTC